MWKALRWLILHSLARDVYITSHANECRIIHPTNSESENLVKIGVVNSEIFGMICQFLPYYSKSYNCSYCNLEGYWTKSHQISMHRREMLPFNHLKLQYCNPFQNASTMNKCSQPILPLKLVTMAMSLVIDHKKNDQLIEPSHISTNLENLLK